MSTPTAAAALPSAEQIEVWRLFLRTHAGVVRRLEAELEASSGMALAEYDVLVQLSGSPTRRLRMTELADRVLLSRSGVTRLVDRLQRQGLVERRPCEGDARGVECAITSAGSRRLTSAAPAHLQGVAEAFVAPLGDDGLDALGALLARVAAQTRLPGDEGPTACGG